MKKKVTNMLSTEEVVNYLKELYPLITDDEALDGAKGIVMNVKILHQVPRVDEATENIAVKTIIEKSSQLSIINNSRDTSNT